MKLLIEEVDSISTEILEEGVGAKKVHKIKGPFIHTEEQNRNGRIYSKTHIIPEVDRYIREMVVPRKALGELTHPQGPQINPKEASHLITSLEWDGNLCIGEAIILDTPNGKIVQAFMEQGVAFGVSTRGLGSIKEQNGVKYVQSDFHLCTVDIVTDPSGHKCWVEGILENKDWIYVDGQGWVESYIEESRKTLQKAKASDVEPLALQIFENYLTKLSSRKIEF